MAATADIFILGSDSNLDFWVEKYFDFKAKSSAKKDNWKGEKGFYEERRITEDKQ